MDDPRPTIIRLALVLLAAALALPGTAAADDQMRVIVELERDPTAGAIRKLERRVGDLDVGHRLELVDAFAAEATREQVEELAGQAGVVDVVEDAPVHAANQPGAQAFGVAKAQLDVPLLDGDLDGDLGAYSPDDLVAAVIDTGIDPGHQDLDGGKVIGWKDFVGDETAAYDDDGHGTHVAATIAGEGSVASHRGVAPGAALVGVKVLDENGDGYTSDVVAGIEWVVENKDLYGIEAINLSLGGDGCGDGTGPDSVAVNEAVAAGLVVTVAAGNEGPGTCTIGAPGDAADGITVGAMADFASGGFSQAWFSSRGPTADGRIKPDVSAPGVGIWSAQAGSASGYVKMNGTSMATPFTAGVALLMLEASPSLVPAAVKQILRDTAVDWGPAGPDPDYGAGRLDAYAALAEAGAALTAPPPAPAHVHRTGTLAGTGHRAEFVIPVTDTSFPIAATMVESGVTAGWSTSPDFDLVLLNPSGQVVESTETMDRQEDIGHMPAATGDYKLRVVSYKGGGPFFVDISGGSAASTQPSEDEDDVVGPTYTAPPADPPPSGGGGSTGGSTGGGSTTSPPAPKTDPPADPPAPREASASATARSFARSLASALRRAGRGSLARRSRLSLRLAVPARGRLSISVTAVRRGRKLVVAKATRTVREGRAKVVVSLTRAGRAWLRSTRRPALDARVSLRLSSGRASSSTRLRLR
jgi:serine protease AprX